MPQIGEIQKLDCGKCKKQTSYVFTEQEIDPLFEYEPKSGTEFLGLLLFQKMGKCGVYIKRGWQCTSCKTFVVVQKISKGSSKS